MRNYLLLLALLAGARACTPGTTFGSQKCCPDGTESPYYNSGIGYACCGEGLATATPVVKSDYKQETSLVVGMTAASKI